MIIDTRQWHPSLTSFVVQPVVVFRDDCCKAWLFQHTKLQHQAHLDRVHQKWHQVRHSGVECVHQIWLPPKLSHFRTFVCRPTNNRATTRPNIRLILHRFGQTDKSSYYIVSLLLTCAGARNIIYTNKLTRKGLNIFQSNFEYPVIFWSNSEYSVTWAVTRACQT